MRKGGFNISNKKNIYTKQKHMKLIITLSLIALLSACNQQNVNIEKEKENLVKLWQDWPTKAKTGDPELWAYYFADDAMIMGQEQPPIKGKGELINFFSVFSKIPGLKVNWGERPNIIEFSKNGDMAYSVDKQEISMTDSTGTVQTKINQALLVWKKDEKGNWRAALVFMYPIQKQ
jgi:ketosteroid isomerase-like protein